MITAFFISRYDFLQNYKALTTFGIGFVILFNIQRILVLKIGLTQDGIE